jgi:hypothetical protein
MPAGVHVVIVPPSSTRAEARPFPIPMASGRSTAKVEPALTAKVSGLPAEMSPKVEKESERITVPSTFAVSGPASDEAITGPPSTSQLPIYRLAGEVPGRIMPWSQISLVPGAALMRPAPQRRS